MAWITLWYIAVIIYRYGKDMVGMCIKLSGYVQISHVAIFRKPVIVQCCKLVKISARIQA